MIIKKFDLTFPAKVHATSYNIDTSIGKSKKKKKLKRMKCTKMPEEGRRVKQNFLDLTVEV